MDQPLDPFKHLMTVFLTHFYTSSCECPILLCLLYTSSLTASPSGGVSLRSWRDFFGGCFSGGVAISSWAKPARNSSRDVRLSSLPSRSKHQNSRAKIPPATQARVEYPRIVHYRKHPPPSPFGSPRYIIMIEVRLTKAII